MISLTRKEYLRLYRIKNSEKRAAYNKEYARLHPETMKKHTKRWKKKNKDKVYAHNKKWLDKNSAKWCAYVTRRKAEKLKATPGWADHEKIFKFYTEASRLTQETGIKHEVDHIIPLKGKTVCGLHVENNLQILTKQQNQMKYNYLVESEAINIQK